MEELSESEQNAMAARSRPEQNDSAWWRLPLLLAIVLVAIVAARSTRLQERRSDSQSPEKTPSAATGKSVSLLIQFGGGRERKFDSIAWFSGMTVDDLMTAASRLPDGIQVGVYGDHERTMLNSIDDAYNEWGGGRNWTYKVNGVAADRSVAVYELEPDDRVLWTFGSQQ